MPKAPKPIANNTFEVEMLSGDKVEIGDKDSADFKPHIKLNRWDGECFIKVSLPTTEKVSPVVEEDKVKFKGKDIEARFYSLEPTAQNELGSFEFEIILKKKPPTNQIIFDIQAQGLRFSYQPPVTQQEIAEGEDRYQPDNVAGSYAVYHATKKNNKYMTGKAFHIYRPMAEDAVGNRVWCALHFDGYLDPKNLTITVPQQFLDEAAYPVVVDPDFGYTTIGGSMMDLSWWTTNTRLGSAWLMPEDGTANFMKVYISEHAGVDFKLKGLINQQNSEGADSHGQIATAELLNQSGVGWKQFSLSGEALTSGETYLLNVIGGGTVSSGDRIKIAVDWNGVDSYRDTEYQNYDSPDDPWNIASGVLGKYSIYVDYSVVALPTVTTQAVTDIGFD